MRARRGRRASTVRIALVGKYVQLADAYLSVVEALRHAGFHHGGADRGPLGRLGDARPTSEVARELDGLPTAS